VTETAWEAEARESAAEKASEGVVTWAEEESEADLAAAVTASAETGTAWAEAETVWVPE